MDRIGRPNDDFRARLTRGDVARVIEAARAIALPGDREIIHVLPQEFTVDDQGGIHDPVGMIGVRQRRWRSVRPARLTRLRASAALSNRRRTDTSFGGDPATALGYAKCRGRRPVRSPSSSGTRATSH